MDSVRIGNGIHVRWKIYNNNGSAYALSGKVRRLWLSSASLEEEIATYETGNRNELTFAVAANRLNRYGVYKLVLQLRESESKTEDATYDLTQVFQIVSKTYPEANVAIDGQVELEFSSVLNNVVVERIEGLSAYEIALNNGYEGTEQEWIAQYEEAVAAAIEAAGEAQASIIRNVTVTVDNTSGTPAATASVTPGRLTLAFSGLKGPQGQRGEKGETGPQGLSGAQGVKGDRGDGIQSVVQTVTSTEGGGANIITVTTTDGREFVFVVRNGSDAPATDISGCVRLGDIVEDNVEIDEEDMLIIDGGNAGL